MVISRGDRGEKQDEPRINKGVKEQEGTRARYVESSNVSVGEGEWCKKTRETRGIDIEKSNVSLEGIGWNRREHF